MKKHHIGNIAQLLTLTAQIKRVIDAGTQVVVTVKEWRSTRSTEQNSRMWAMLADFSAQVKPHGIKYTAEDWKDIMTASFSSELRMAPTRDGSRIVILGLRTSKMNIAKMSEFTEYLNAEGALDNVKWSDPALPENAKGGLI